MIVSQPREKLWAFMNARMGIPWSSDFRAIGVVRGDLLCAVVGYNGFMGRVCFMHSAIDDPSVIDRTFVRAIFEYPFDQCGVKYIFAAVDEKNQQALDIDFRCGFELYDTLAGGAEEGSDLLLLRLTRDNCRWLKDRHGKRVTSATGLRGRSEGAGRRVTRAH